MIWQATNNIIYLPLFILVAVIAAFGFKKASKAIKQLVHPDHKFLLENYSPRRAVAKLALFCVALLFLFLVLLNPSAQSKDELVEQRCRDVFVVLDVSKSMLAQDIHRNRLEFTKDKIKSFLKLLPGDRAGLVLFASDAFVQCPLTRDHSAFNMFLDQIDSDTVSGGSTSLASALRVCMDQCKKENSQSKVVVIFTDGEDFSSDLLNVKKEAQDLDLHIFTIGVGTADGAKIPLFNRMGDFKGYQKDRSGNEVVTKLNEGIIQNLAEEFNGIYVPLFKDSRDIKKIVREVKKFEKQKIEDKRLAKVESIYPIFALVAFVALLISWIL